MQPFPFRPRKSRFRDQRTPEGSNMATTTPGFNVVLADDFSGGYKTENWGTPFDGGTYWNGMFQ